MNNSKTLGPISAQLIQELIAESKTIFTLEDASRRM